MDVENSFIRPILTFYYGKGLSEIEAYEEVSKKYGPRGISLKTIRKWYITFKSKDSNSVNKPNYIHKTKFTDEFLINLVKENPELNMKELAKLADCSVSVISRRIKNINKDGIRVDYHKKDFQNNGPSPFELKKPLFTDEYLIDLVNENPKLSMIGLAKLANCSKTTILNRLNQINNSGVEINYNRKNHGIGIQKFTDEFLINEIKNNPNLSIDELAELADCAKSTINNRLKQINSHRADDHKIILKVDSSKTTKTANRLADDFFINLVKDNPDLNITQLAKLTNISRQTISRRLKIINNKEDDTASKYHIMTELYLMEGITKAFNLLMTI